MSNDLSREQVCSIIDQATSGHYFSQVEILSIEKSLKDNDAALRARVDELERKLNTYIEWDNDADECYVPGHADLAALRARVAELEQQSNDTKGE